MKISHPRTPMIVAVGWVATAAIAFSIGRIGGSSERATNAESPAGAAASQAGGSQKGGPTDDGAVRAAAMNAQFGTAENGGRITLERLTNGQPLDQWMKHLMSQEDNILRMGGLLRFLETVRDPADLKVALEAINLRGDRGFGRGSRFSEYSMILEKWAHLDAKGAIACVETKTREEKMLGTSAVLRTWTRTDPSAAIAWAQANGSKQASAEAGSQGGPGGSPGWGGQGNMALSMVLSQLAHTELDRALSVAATETFDRHSRTLGTLASEMVSQRGLDGALSAFDAIAPGSLKDGLATQIAEKYANANAPAAAEWALGLPDGEPKSRALAETIGEWAKKDPAAAGAFLAKLPTTPETDRSRESYANRIAEKNPESALAWASSIVDEERKTRAVTEVARTWARQDADAAKAWISQSTLPEEVKARVQAPGRGGSGFSRSRGPGN